MRADVLGGGPLDNLQVTKSRELNGQILERLGRLIDE